jgi:hypothetical protein
MTVIGNVPVVVGVPERIPPKMSGLDNDRPEGGAFVSLQVCGFAPPFAVNLKLYGRFIAAAGGDGNVTMLIDPRSAIWIV